ncbi:hypothetical protein [Saccharopolyspora pogona]|uniref:hypothetical protein n=1 Tax=Saccharopolyspora pogona TaxID=333966 RepID=UPI001687B36C|nr:hypothetical protein [Saccharopolyspora pogona]
MDERSIDELIEIAEGMPRTNGLAAGLDAVRGTARGEGVSLAVDLQGMLVGLELDDRALALGPAGLAAEISRLSNEAGTDSLRQGMLAIQAGCGAEVAAAVGDYLISIEDEAEQPAPEPPSRPVTWDDEDVHWGSTKKETW